MKSLFIISVMVAAGYLLVTQVPAVSTYTAKLEEQLNSAPALPAPAALPEIGQELLQQTLPQLTQVQNPQAQLNAKTQSQHQALQSLIDRMEMMAIGESGL